MKSNPQSPSFYTHIAAYSLLLKSICIFLLYFLILNFQSLICNLYAQQPTQEWVARYFGPSNDLRGPYLAVDKLGNSYLAGTHVINDSINILVAKYNTSGTQLWATLYKYPGEGYFSPMAFAIDTFGNAYVTAKYGQTVLSFHNTLTVKFNTSNGTVAWAKRYIGGPRHNIPEDIKIDKNNNIYVVGASDSALLCIKYNISGDSVWVRKYQPLAFNYANACTIDDSLNIIITGIKTHCVSFPPPGACFDTLLTVKYSQNGDLRWAKTYFYPGNPSFNAGLKITNDQFGNIFIGGRTRPNIGTRKYLTLKYDLNGNYQWASLYDGPGSGDDNLSSISLDRFLNSLYVTGVVPGANNQGESSTLKYNTSTGDSMWVRRNIGIYSNSTSKDIKVDTLGNVYVTGSTYNIPPTLGAVLTIKLSTLGNISWLTTYNGFGSGVELELDRFNNIYVCGVFESDYIIIKYSQVSGIQIIGNEIPGEFKLSQNYPNPFNPGTKIKFSVPKKSKIKLNIFDVLGRALSEPVNAELPASVYQVDINGTTFASGVYFYRLIADGKIIDTKKFIVIK